MKTGLNCFKKVKWQFYSKSFLVFLVSFIRLSMPSFLVCCNFKTDIERGDKKGVVCLPFCKKNNLNNLFTYLLLIILIWNLPQKCLWLYPVFFRIPTCCSRRNHFFSFPQKEEEIKLERGFSFCIIIQGQEVLENQLKWFISHFL